MDQLATRPARIARPSRADRPHPATTPDPAAIRRRTGRIPWGFLGALVAIVAAESIVAPRWRELSDPVSLSWRFADEAARHDAKGKDLLFLGDSLVKHGLIPSVVEASSGLSGANLAAARGPALLTDFILRRAIESGARPSAIVIETKPAVLIGGADYNAHYWPAALTARECLEMGWAVRKGTLGLAAMTARLIPSLQSRLEIRSGLMASLNGTTDRIPEINRMLLRNWTTNDGANVALLESPYRGLLSPEIQEKLHPDKWYVDHSNKVGIDRMLKRSRDHQIRVFWLLPPISPGLQAWRERSGAESHYEKFVRSYCDRFPATVTILDGRRIAREPSLYVDATHLSGRGAIVLSRSIAPVMASELRSPKLKPPAWITLEEPPAAPDPPLEDVEQSRRIVNTASK